MIMLPRRCCIRAPQQTVRTRVVFVTKRTFFSGQSSSSSSSSSSNFSSNYQKRLLNRDAGLGCTSVVSNPNEVEGPEGLPSRAEQVRRLMNDNNQQEKGVDSNHVYDVLVVGGGATGAGCALDAATRGLRVACIERGDFSSETSSRSTKLVWAGIKYMATASVALLSYNLFYQPLTTLRAFATEMKMVLHCHQERRYMMDKQRHLCNWIPIAIPFTKWHVSPPPFGHPLFGFFPILAPFVLKFYDALSGFQCPPSYILTKSKATTVFPQLDVTSGLKYCAVFYEAQHNDARTNLAIALSAAQHGAHIANYVEMTDMILDETDQQTVVGVQATDRMTGQVFEIRAKKIVFCGGPFTDEMRQIEHEAQQTTDSNTMQKAVRGAHGTHIVLPGEFCPKDVSLCKQRVTILSEISILCVLCVIIY